MELVLRPLLLGDEGQFVASFADHPFSYFEPGMEFAAFLDRLREVAAGRNLPAGHVPNTQLFGDVAGTLVGVLRIRHELVGMLETLGGHIGYRVLEQHRRRGYATAMLRQALPVCAALGLERVLVTCDQDNIGSRMVIEANGGDYESTIHNGRLRAPKLRYWIATGQGARARTKK